MPERSFRSEVPRANRRAGSSALDFVGRNADSRVSIRDLTPRGSTQVSDLLTTMGEPSVDDVAKDIQSLTFDISTSPHFKERNPPLPPPFSTSNESPSTAEGASTSNSSPPPLRSQDSSQKLNPTASSQSKQCGPFQFGTRYLPPCASDSQIFTHNAWDHVSPDAEYLIYASEQYARQRSSPVSDFDRHRVNSNPQKWWDLFYKQKTSTFFKDRKWLQQEFPLLREVTEKDAGGKIVLEVGAGAGNTAFPILRENENPGLKVWACDFSKRAVETIRNSEEYDERFMRAEIWDVTGEDLPSGLQEGSVDVVIMIFIFSALEPGQWSRAVRNVYRALKAGGEVLFRDYGRGDMAQVRFRKERWMSENFYVRGDGTRVYFFDKEELERVWGGEHDSQLSSNGPESEKEDAVEEERSSQANKEPSATESSVVTETCSRAHEEDSSTLNGDHDDTAGHTSLLKPPRFEIIDLNVDRRMIVNRSRRIKMYRCWIQGRFKKPK